MFFLSWRGWLAVSGVVFAALALPCVAQPGPSDSTRETLALSQALARALADNPGLKVFDARRRVAAGQQLQAGLYPNPDIGITVEDFGGSGVERGLQGMQTTLSLSQLVPLGGKLERRLAVATAGAGQVEADRAVARLDVLAETARRYTDVAEARARVKLAQRGVALAEKMRAAVQRRVRAGATPKAELDRAEVALTRARLDATQAASKLDARRIALAAMWGAAAADFARVTGALEKLPALRPFAVFASAALKAPRIARFGADRRLRAAELALAQAQRVPDLTVNIGVRRLEYGATGGTPDYGLVAGLSLPLKLFDRNQGNIAAARARVDETAAERKAATLRIRTVLYGLYRADVQARARVKTLANTAIPQATRALEQIRRGYARGRFSLLDLLDIQRQLIQLRGAAITTRADAHRLDAELERLSAEPVVAPLSPPTTRHSGSES